MKLFSNRRQDEYSECHKNLTLLGKPSVEVSYLVLGITTHKVIWSIKEKGLRYGSIIRIYVSFFLFYNT